MDLHFLEDAPKGTFSVVIRSRDGTILHQLDTLPQDLLYERLPRLVDRAAVCKDGHLEFTFEGPSVTSIFSMLRFAIHGDYTLCEQLQDGPDSVLLHLQMFALGDWFKSEELQARAANNVKNVMWMASSDPFPISDLTLAVHFLYTVLDKTPGTQNMREDLAYYVLGQWDYHCLEHHVGLQPAMRQCPRFMQDLSLANTKSNFELAGASVVCRRNLEDCRDRDHVRTHGLCDFLCDYHNEHDGVLYYFAEQRRYWEEPTFSLAPQITLPIHSKPAPLADPAPPYERSPRSPVPTLGSAFTCPNPFTPVPSTWDGRATSIPLSALNSDLSRRGRSELEAFSHPDPSEYHLDEGSETESDGSYDLIDLPPRGSYTSETISAGLLTDDDSATISDTSSEFTIV